MGWNRGNERKLEKRSSRGEFRGDRAPAFRQFFAC
jgi:hypothetical protein